MSNVELIKATREITVGYMIPGEREPRATTFLAKQVTRVSSEDWGAMKSKTSVQGYLDEGLLEHVNAGRANAIAEGKEHVGADDVPPLQKAAEIYAKTGDGTQAKAELERAMDEVKHGPTPQNTQKQRR